MPIYEYCCDNCQKVFEEWTRHVGDNATQACPECGGAAGRIVSNTSFVLKGGGWYVTDYGYRKGKNEGAESSGGSTPGSAAGQVAAVATDKVPAAKPAEASGKNAAASDGSKSASPGGGQGKQSAA